MRPPRGEQEDHRLAEIGAVGLKSPREAKGMAILEVRQEFSKTRARAEAAAADVAKDPSATKPQIQQAYRDAMGTWMPPEEEVVEGYIWGKETTVGKVVTSPRVGREHDLRRAPRFLERICKSGSEWLGSLTARCCRSGGEEGCEPGLRRCAVLEQIAPCCAQEGNSYLAQAEETLGCDVGWVNQKVQQIAPCCSQTNETYRAQVEETLGCEVGWMKSERVGFKEEKGEEEKDDLDTGWKAGAPSLEVAFSEKPSHKVVMKKSKARKAG